MTMTRWRKTNWIKC